VAQVTRFLCIALFALSGTVSASVDVTLDLSAVERDWLVDNRSVSICVDPISY